MLNAPKGMVKAYCVQSRAPPLFPARFSAAPFHAGKKNTAAPACHDGS